MLKTKTYAVPVYWEVTGFIEVEALSEKDALMYVRANLDSFPLPPDPQYIEDSFQLDEQDDDELLETIFVVSKAE